MILHAMLKGTVYRARFHLLQVDRYQRFSRLEAGAQRVALTKHRIRIGSARKIPHRVDNVRTIRSFTRHNRN